MGDTWYVDSVFVTINGQRQYLRRAVAQDGDVIDTLVQSRRNGRAAERLFHKLLNGQGKAPLRLVTDKLKSYGAAHRMFMPSVNHETQRYANNRAEVSHPPTRQRNDKREGSNLHVRYSDFSLFTESCPESFPSWAALADID